MLTARDGEIAFLAEAAGPLGPTITRGRDRSGVHGRGGEGIFL